MPPRITAVLLLAAALAMPADLAYQKPPHEILDVLNAPPPPLISVNPSRDYAILMQPLRYPPIAEALLRARQSQTAAVLANPDPRVTG